MISAKEILMGRDFLYPLSEDLIYNLFDLLPRINFIRFHYAKPMYVTSGYRPPEINKAQGGAQNSAHMYCQAIDFMDIDRSLSGWCMVNTHLLEQAGLYIEDPKYTPTWCHFQSRQPESGNIIFKP